MTLFVLYHKRMHAQWIGGPLCTDMASRILTNPNKQHIIKTPLQKLPSPMHRASSNRCERLKHQHHLQLLQESKLYSLQIQLSRFFSTRMQLCNLQKQPMARLVNMYPYMIKRTTQKFVPLNLLRVKAKQFACQNISQTVELHKFVIQEARSDTL